MDLYSTAELRKVIVDSRPPVQYFIDRLYPEQMNFTTEEILFDEMRLGKRMAPFVAPNVQGRVIKRSGFYTRSFRPAYVKPKDAVTPGRMLRRLAGEAITGDQTPGQRWQAVVAAYQLDQRNQIYRRWEWMAAQAALYGKVTVSGEDYPTVEIDFGRDPSHTVVLTGDARWSEQDTSDPDDDLETWGGRVHDAEGYAVTRVTMGRLAWKAFKKHPRIKELLETRRGSTSEAETGPGLGESVEYKGQIGSYRIYVYSDVYEADDGTMQPMMDPRDVLLEASGYEGVRAFGAIMDADADLQALEIFPKMWKNPDPSVVYLMSQSAPLMVPSRANCTLRARVVS